MALLEVKGLSCGYGKRKVLEGINLSLSGGEVMGVIGPNGSGKTTLLRAISGWIRSMEGEVLLDGRDIRSIGQKEVARKMAVVAQAPQSIPSFTVEEFVLLGRIPHWRPFQVIEDRRDMEVAERAMHLTGIEDLRGRDMRELSGGERQLVCLARALAQEPELMLLDEPTAHLDIGHQLQIMDLLMELNGNEGLTLIVVLHDLNLASLYCQRLVLLDQGRIYREGTPQEVINEAMIRKIYGGDVTIQNHPLRQVPIILPRGRD